MRQCKLSSPSSTARPVQAVCHAHQQKVFATWHIFLETEAQTSARHACTCDLQFSAEGLSHAEQAHVQTGPLQKPVQCDHNMICEMHACRAQVLGGGAAPPAASLQLPMQLPGHACCPPSAPLPVTSHPSILRSAIAFSFPISVVSCSWGLL